MACAVAASRSDARRSRAELVARRAPRASPPPSRRAPPPARRRVVALRRPEIVPVRMHRLGRVALVADRRAASGRRRRARPAARFAAVRSRRAQRVHDAASPRRRAATSTPAARGRACSDQTSATRKTNSPSLSFSATGSAPRASTQHGTLPSANWCGANQRRKSRATSAVAEPQQRLRHHRAVADPRARVGARARAQDRAVAVDEQMRRARCAACRPPAARRAARRIDTRLSFSRQCAAAASSSRAIHVAGDSPLEHRLRRARAAARRVPRSRCAPGASARS